MIVSVIALTLKASEKVVLLDGAKIHCACCDWGEPNAAADQSTFSLKEEIIVRIQDA